MIRYVLFRLLGFFELCLFLRAILSWIPGRIEWLEDILYQITEPARRPISDFLMRFQWAQNLPIDLSYLVLFFLIEMLRSLI